MSGAVIAVEHVSWAYSGSRCWALTDINLAINAGEFIAVMGENGAGKTSFCRLLNGLIPHSLPGRLVGTVTVAGIRTDSSTVAQLARKVGSVFDDPLTQLFTARVSDEAAFALENLLTPPGEIRERVSRALEAVGLSGYADYAPSALSGGQKQRLAIAAALAMAETILVLDEPVSQLDPDGAKDVLALINDLCLHKKLTVVMAASSGKEAELADKVCVLHNGSLAAYDTPQRIFADSRLLDTCGIAAPDCQFSGFGIPRGPLQAGTILRIQNVCYQYTGGRMILHDINLDIRENDFIIITGHNGSGKTTLLKNICGLLRPVQGNILLGERDTAEMGISEIAEHIGFIMQDPDQQLFESTVYDEVAFSLKRAGKKEIITKAEEALSTVGLLDRRTDFPLALCRADRVKAVFAAILAMGPRIIMLDEPFAGQDMRGCRLIMDILAGLHRNGYTILVVTHNAHVMADARRLVVMKDGSIVSDSG